MSRLFPSRLAVLVEPYRLVFELKAKRDQRSWTKPVTQDVTAASFWQPAIDTLAFELQAIEARLVLDSTLSSSMVRYAIVPWHPDFASGADRAGLVQHTFVQVYGDVARNWTVRSSDTQFGKTALAAAIDTSLLDALRQATIQAGHTPGLVQPDLMAGFNRARSQISTDSFWYAMVSADTHLLFLTLHGQPRAVHMARRSEASLGTLLDRAWLSLGEEDQRCPVYATTPSGTAQSGTDAGQWQLHWLATPVAAASGAGRPRSWVPSTS